MKQRPEPLMPYDAAVAVGALAHVFAALKGADEVQAFLEDLCTPAELEAMGDRWRVVPHLLKGEPYREIHEHTKVSVTTIGRVARCIERGAGGYGAAAQRMQLISETL
ncbi:MAG TPA: YerC/YecD family TrpR-related protein [Thermomonas sp.]|uniref:YerC/YecD family TrpR-related protein n=1 Tax=Thermomonas sp. TaxID=1971895 RepID=UPI002C49C2C6|nr:YerC/YecD family TrpR-related protein [Thermomonas sp.]HOV96083.1 YerC/YecD family TrpR-related protein [Thermomonas sp.]